MYLSVQLFHGERSFLLGTGNSPSVEHLLYRCDTWRETVTLWVEITLYTKALILTVFFGYDLEYLSVLVTFSAKLWDISSPD